MTGINHAYSRLDSDRPHDAFSRTLDFVRFPGAEAAERARRERAVAVRARLAVLAADGTRRQDDLHRLAHAGTEPTLRAESMHRLADLREESADRHDELAVLEPGQTEAHRTAAAQARDRAAHDREFAELLAPQDPITALRRESRRHVQSLCGVQHVMTACVANPQPEQETDRPPPSGAERAAQSPSRRLIAARLTLAVRRTCAPNPALRDSPSTIGEPRG